MILNWKEYIFRFKVLMANGYIVVRDGRTSVYWLVDMFSEFPSKLYFREAWDEYTSKIQEVENICSTTN